MQKMRKRLETYEAKERLWQNQRKELKEKCEFLSKKLSALSSSGPIKKIEHSPDFWSSVKNNCAKKTGPFGTDSIKTMVKTGKMTVHDTDQYGSTLLLIASSYGAYDLARFLLNNVE